MNNDSSCAFRHPDRQAIGATHPPQSFTLCIVMDAIFGGDIAYVVLGNSVHLQVNSSPKTSPGREWLHRSVVIST